MKNKMKFIKLLIILIVMVSFAVYIFQNTVVLAQDGTEENNNQANAIESLDSEQLSRITANLQQMLQGIPWSSSSPINSSTFNKNPNYFCVQHGTAYATTSNIDGFQGNYDHMNTSGLASVNYNGGWDIKTPAIGTTIRTDHKEEDSEVGEKKLFKFPLYRDTTKL